MKKAYLAPQVEVNLITMERSFLASAEQVNIIDTYDWDDDE